MWCMFLATAVINFFFYTIVSAFGTKVARDVPSQPESYHCGHAVFEYSALQDAANEANREFCTWHQLCTDSPGPSRLSIYRGSLKFGQLQSLLVWPLLRPGISSLRHGDVETYLLVLSEDITIQIVGVITRKKDGTEIPCEAKPKEIDGVGVSRSIGFRCMTDYFPPEGLLKAKEEVIEHRNKFDSSKPHRLPSRIDGRALFNRPSQLLSWPIRPDGTFNLFAPTFLVLDLNNRMVGMLEKSRNTEFRCKPSTDATPKFTGPGLNKQRKNVILIQDIFFTCGKYTIAGSMALEAAVKAMEYLRQSKYEFDKKELPRFGEYDQYKTNSHLYIWKIDATVRRYSSNTGQYRNVEFYAILTDFCDVYRVLMRKSGSRYAFCKKKTLSSGKTIDVMEESMNNSPQSSQQIHN